MYHPWDNENILKKRENVEKAYQNNLKRSEVNLNEPKKLLQEDYNLEQEKYANVKINEITNAIEHLKSGITWQTVNELTGGNGINKGRITATDERVQKKKDHFSNLLNQPPTITSKPTVTIIHENLSINTEDITVDELGTCIKSFKNNKASGLNNIPS